MTVTSALNAMAHAAEGLYAQDRNPISTLMAIEGLRALHGGAAGNRRRSRRTSKHAGRRALRRLALRHGARQVGMALHHKLCHTLGGSLRPAACRNPCGHAAACHRLQRRRRARLLAPSPTSSAGSAGAGLYDFAKSLGAPLALEDLGLSEADLDRAAEIATAKPYWNPRPFDRDRNPRTAAGRLGGRRRPDEH